MPAHLARIDIHEVACNYCSLLEDIIDPSVHNSLSQMFDRNLDDIKRKYSPNFWIGELEILLQKAKLNLYAMSFLIPRRQDSMTNLLDDHHRETSLLLGLGSASTLIDQVKMMSTHTVAEGSYPGGKLTFYPKDYLKSLFFATSFLFRIITNKHSVPSEQKILAIKAVAESHKIFRLFPNERDATRAARLIEKFMKMARAADASPDPSPLKELVITNRLGASVMWDTFFRTWQHMRSNDANRANASALEWNLSNETGEEDLPLAPEMKEDIQGSHPASTCNIPMSLLPDAAYWTSWDAYKNDFELGFDQQFLG